MPILQPFENLEEDIRIKLQTKVEKLGRNKPGEYNKYGQIVRNEGYTLLMY